MLMGEAVGIGGGGRVEISGGGEKGERNSRQWDDHWRDNVLFLVTEIVYIACPLLLLPLACLSQL